MADVLLVPVILGPHGQLCTFQCLKQYLMAFSMTISDRYHIFWYIWKKA